MKIAALTDDEQSILDALLVQWEQKRSRNVLRTGFYDMQNATSALMSKQIPDVIRRRKFVLGWSAIAVDKLARRTNLAGFHDVGGADLDSLGLADWIISNRLIKEVSQAGTASLINGCSFLVTTLGDASKGEPPVLTLAVSADRATGLWSRRTKSLTSFISIHELGERNEPTVLTFYLPNLIHDCMKVDGTWQVETRPHAHGVPVDPLRYKERLDRPFGSSRISRTVMSLHMQALATMIRAEVNGEAYSLPRFVLLGATEDAFRSLDGSPKAPWQAAWDAVWAIGDDMDVLKSGAPQLARADVKQLQGQSPEPQNAHLRMLAQMFSGETGVPIGELGIIGDSNPTSADALLVSRDDLIAEAGVTMDGWSDDIASAARRALTMLNGGDVPKGIRPQWRNPMHVSTAQAADAGSKILGTVPWLAETSVGLEILGLTPDQAQRAANERQRAEARQTLQSLQVETSEIQTVLEDLFVAACPEAFTQIVAPSDASAEETRAALFDLATAAVASYRPAAAELGVAWYLDQRPADLAEFEPKPSTAIPDEELSAMIAATTVALWKTNNGDVPIKEAIVASLASLSGGIQRIVTGGFRDTIIDATGLDPSSVGYRRVARPAACSYCARLSMHTYPAGDKAAFKAHNHCFCIPAAVF